MATVDMHKKFGKVWHVLFKICEQTYKQTHSVGNVQGGPKNWHTWYFLPY